MSAIVIPHSVVMGIEQSGWRLIIEPAPIPDDITRGKYRVHVEGSCLRNSYGASVAEAVHKLGAEAEADQARMRNLWREEA